MSDEDFGSQVPRRNQRVADLIREEVASYLIKGNKNTRIGFVTITNVDLTADLQVARVYFSAYGSPAEKQESIEGLMESAPQIRSHLARVLRMRVIPKIEFRVDEGLENSYRIQELLGQVASEKSEAATAATSESEEDDEESSDDETDPVADAAAVAAAENRPLSKYQKKLLRRK